MIMHKINKKLAVNNFTKFIASRQNSSLCSADIRIVKQEIGYEILLTQREFSYYHFASAKQVSEGK